MKKAYILSYQRRTNYGAILQIFALSKTIKNLGIDVEVIDYIPSWMEINLKNQPSIKSLIKRKIMDVTFKKFYKNINYTVDRFYSEKELLNKLNQADYYIVGSDQVWNEQIMKRDRTYFLSFAPDNSIKISYAASMGDNIISNDFESDVKKLIMNFNHISVREKFVADYVKTIRKDIKTPIVLDPTLLLNSEDYESITRDKIYKKPFIAVYSCMHDENIYKYANKIKNITKLPLINLGYHFKGVDRTESIFGPENWLARLKNAKYIITNSFHGTAFSIIFQKKFITVPTNNPLRKGLNSRFIELLDSLHLSSRTINSELDLKILDNDIDYYKTNELLSIRKKESLEFLKGSLNG